MENRVLKGGHNVAADKITSRYYNTLNNLIQMIEIADQSYLFDNSSIGFKLIAKIAENKLEINVERNELPNWFINYVRNYYFIP